MALILNLLERRSWAIERRRLPGPLLPDHLARQFPGLPKDLVEFLGDLEVCRNAPETAWLLTAQDYRGLVPGNFRWDEFRHMALESAAGSEAEEIEEFWSRHFPFALSTHSDYDYLAVQIGEAGAGPIVHGFAPFWEEPSVIASSFSDFMQQYEHAAESSDPLYPYSLFL